MILDYIKPLFSILPEVKTPIHRQDFKEKLKWTAIVLVLYFFLTQVPLYGLSPLAVDQFAQMRAVMAGSFGSILTLGIGPIVTSSIVLQLLVGAKILKLDLSRHEDKALFQGTQKILAIVFTVFEAAVLVYTGSLIPTDPSLLWLLMLQLIIGALLILFLDEVVSKWGFGSGIGLFIAAGVSEAIVVGTFNFLPTKASPGVMPGMIPKFIQSITSGSPDPTILIPLIATIGVFLVAVYGESMRVEIPISHGQVKGHGRIRGSVAKYPLKFIYASNMPVILTSALLVNVSLMASVFQKLGFPILGQVEGGKAISGLAYYLTTPSSLGVVFTDPLKVLIYGVFFIGFCILFSWLWVEMSGLNAKEISKQLYNSGIQIPGFRSSKRQLYKILNKYIPALTVLGGVFVGLLAFGADLTQAVGGGTGVLLTVGIVYKLYEEIAQEQLMDMHPMLRKFLGD
ncbi:MAG: preprotein translocase subunit SecY [Methanobrevibacter arboriphilus]|jgi:preprotein translocase subunit SecY|uniref:Preprotein translocase subunit SecY n=2 Tax=Methanobrevibacter arboriphilus TaxID=39441 RepID=A0ACA8R2R8_METAZ|nr:preprotein translocase subunit SecY [Methanobrevibacter arboriphilus]MBF4468180.1 preprotein translocase subunit SecY [Methanobrevibacter arboriphilus]MCC7562007.1 preprotein translocase subunit SecY [Methanobrevibacter arboriphilus]BBL61607.1 preprotein translocase subunit SecY [Methanobrevibacter arboriphilus]GLI12521.1 preprotein translocase subunit SecY [Methanobrevibacter arboriphilus]